jgi:hypothetical protein
MQPARLHSQGNIHIYTHAALRLNLHNTHGLYTVNKCTRLKQSIPRDRYVALYACNIHVSTTYTCSLQVKRKSCKHTKCNTYVFVVQSRLYNQELFSQQSSFRLPSLTCLMLYYMGPICNLHTVISMQST